MNKSILVTGGAGYIGSHTCIELLAAGYEVAVLDNLCNSKVSALERVREISGQDLAFFNADLLNLSATRAAIEATRPDAVIHFAGLKAVGESVEKPLWYYRNNVGGTLNLLAAMAEAGVRDLVFSSSCTVYGEPEELPLTEDAPLRTTNPYGATKLAIENILRDLQAYEPEWNISLLRYFNPVGAHESGRLGEDPQGIPNNLMPFIQQVAVGRLDCLRVWGDDYETPDGTGVRDYIHVTDLAVGHLRALEKLEEKPGLITHNLGTGQGHSVLEVVRAFEAATGNQIPCRIEPRRPGDIAATWADPSKAERELGWTAARDLETMCRDAWRWQKNNPQGLPD